MIITVGGVAIGTPAGVSTRAQSGRSIPLAMFSVAAKVR
jgi:hypothetical protein